MRFRIVRKSRPDTTLVGFGNLDEAIEWFLENQFEEDLVIIDRDGTKVWPPESSGYS